MKRLKWGILISLLIPFALAPLGYEEQVSASVQPNQYQEKQINVNTDYLHEDSLLERRESLSEELLNLTFDGEKLTTFDELREELFLSPAQETNTITSRAQEMGLFSEEREISVPYTEEENQNSGSNWNIMILVLGGIVAAAIALMLFLLLKYSSGTANNRAG